MILTALAAAIAAVSLSAQVRVRTTAGLVQGVRTDIFTTYKGIPFAAPPVGELRWREPQPPRPWRGVRRADKFAPAPMQTGVSMPGETPPATSEDCLYINVWAPTEAKAGPVPVMVWIYGGGFTNGSASMPLYWGDRLARKGIIVVTFGYRVGPLGFLALPELTRESPHHSSGNYGFLDQIAALRWVHGNIAAFGGDPSRVTIAGQSAGATSVSILMSSPLARGLFQRAIGQSGGMFEPIRMAPRFTLANAEREGTSYAKSLGADSLAELRALPASALMRGEAGQVSHPVIEPHVLPESPYDAFVAGKQSGVSILIGSNADEARSLVVDLDKVRATTFEQEIANAWGALPPQLFLPYPHATDDEARKGRLDFERDLRFGWDIWAWARLMAAKRDAGVYCYQFTHKPPFPPASVRAGWGAGHFAELWYTFDHLDQERWAWSEEDRKLADTMATYWTNFVKTGNPNQPGLPDWPEFGPQSGRVQYLDSSIRTGGVANMRALEAFDAVYSQVRGTPFGVRPK